MKRAAPKHPHPAFALMLAESKLHALPTHFGTDLTVHDADALRTFQPSDGFAWFVYEHGTHTCPAGYRMSRKHSPGDTLRSLWAHVHDTDAARVYVWDGSALHHCRSVYELTDRMEALQLWQALTARCDDAGGLDIEVRSPSNGNVLCMTLRHYQNAAQYDFSACSFGPGARERLDNLRTQNGVAS